MMMIDMGKQKNTTIQCEAMIIDGKSRKRCRQKVTRTIRFQSTGRSIYFCEQHHQAFMEQVSLIGTSMRSEQIS